MAPSEKAQETEAEQAKTAEQPAEVSGQDRKKKLGLASPGYVMLGMLASAGIAFGTTLPTWVRAQVHTALNQSAVEVAGSDAAPVVSSLALVALAAAVAVRIAAPAVRWLVCAIAALAGIGMIFSVSQVLRDPAGATVTEVGEATGLVGSAADYSFSFWPWLALAAAVLVLFSALWAGFASRRWPRKRKYERKALVVGEEMDEIDTWDSLTAGVDPTK